MSAETNEINALRFYREVFNNGNLDLVDQLVDPEIVDHNAPPGLPAGIDGYRQEIVAFRTAFPDIHFIVEDLLMEGHTVVVRGTAHGTHQGEFLGIPPTHKQITMAWIDILRFAGGKQAEVWHLEDLLGIIQQLGGKITPDQVSG